MKTVHSPCSLAVLDEVQYLSKPPRGPPSQGSASPTRAMEDLDDTQRVPPTTRMTADGRPMIYSGDGWEGEVESGDDTSEDESSEWDGRDD